MATLPTWTKVRGVDKLAKFEVSIGLVVSEYGAPAMADKITWV